MAFIQRTSPEAKYFFWREEGNHHCSACPSSFTGHPTNGSRSQTNHGKIKIHEIVCDMEEDCNEGAEKCSGTKCAGYRGTQAKTTSGRTCQAWDQQTPHKHNNSPQKKPTFGLEDNNNCRNPDGAKTMWCYTTDPKKRWELCEPRDCNAEEAGPDGKKPLKPFTPPPQKRPAKPTTGGPTPKPNHDLVAKGRHCGRSTTPEEDQTSRSINAKHTANL